MSYIIPLYIIQWKSVYEIVLAESQYFDCSFVISHSKFHFNSSLVIKMLVIESIKQWSKNWVPGKNCKIDNNSFSAMFKRLSLKCY
jgi:hypothetical protein